jgi:oligopeptidase B
MMRVNVRRQKQFWMFPEVVDKVQDSDFLVYSTSILIGWARVGQLRLDFFRTPAWKRLLIMKLLPITSALLILSGAAMSADEPLVPPVAKKIDKTDVRHGETCIDPYFWLREKENPEVQAYLKAENEYAAAFLKPTEAFQQTLYKEMLGRIKETDLSVPYREGAYFYYSRTEEGKQYPIYCRKKGSLDGAEEVMLDLNEMAKTEKFLNVEVRAVSDDGNLLAYSTDTTGFREYTLYVKDLRTGKLSSEKIPKVDAACWAADNKTIFYVTEDDAKRPYRLYRHTLGADPATDTLLFEEKDELFGIWCYRTRSRSMIVLQSGSKTSNECQYVRADKPTDPLTMLIAREKDHEFEIDHRGDEFFIMTNSTGRNYRLVKAPVSDPRRENWKEIVPHRTDVLLEGVLVFQDHVVVMERESGLPHVSVMDLQSGKSHRVEMQDAAYAVFPENNREFNTSTFRFSYQSMTTPSSVFDYDLKTGERKLLKETEVLGGYDRTKYQSERTEATAPDGTKVPISLVYKKGFKRDGQAPLFLYAYGSYGFSMPVHFSSIRLSLLDRGFVCGIAHIRGGMEMGKKWHEDGRMLKKKNTFTDFIACAEHLIKEKYTTNKKLVIEGGSAGGLLMGAVVNMRPDLFGIVISQVPFVDVINTMSDPTLPLTVPEYEEWGNPQIKEYYDYMKSYCPYSNLQKKEYPTMLVRTSLNDSQVMYWEPAKYVARLRTLKTDKNPLLLITNMDAGHGGSSGRYDALKEDAQDYAFILTQLGIYQ